MTKVHHTWGSLPTCISQDASDLQSWGLPQVGVSKPSLHQRGIALFQLRQAIQSLLPLGNKGTCKRLRAQQARPLRTGAEEVDAPAKPGAKQADGHEAQRMREAILRGTLSIGGRQARHVHEIGVHADSIQYPETVAHLHCPHQMPYEGPRALIDEPGPSTASTPQG